MTVWQIGETWFWIAACAVAWIWGGRPERFAAGLLLLDEYVSMHLTFHWRIEHAYSLAVATYCGMLLVFGWMALRGRRWWPLAMTAILGLVLATYGLKLGNPTLSHFAAASARVGLFYLMDLALLVSVLERWLAGERPAGPAAWIRAERVAAARRGRKARPADPGERSAPPRTPRPGASTEARGA